jgi:hypothetical protein
LRSRSRDGVPIFRAGDHSREGVIRLRAT